MAEKFKSQTESVLNLPSHYVNAVSESSWGNKWPWGYKWPGRGRGRGRGGRGRGRGRGRENNQPVEMSIDDLNDDLENYHAEAKNT
ncbi:hypothetical protein CJ030_MR7G013049 [Morella rubra]|uniref:Chromatin target of PRMT1 protein C-terminal domain-containing protein n=1 Tax=Morella rubra TaxID=262757 RepID=A0A6A1V5M2_9ROSI|nr:hypothetical protein CJ030_MR7G013049 [Morella rubra]